MMRRALSTSIVALTCACTVEAARNDHVATADYAADAGFANTAGSATSAGYAADAGRAGTADSAAIAAYAADAGTATNALALGGIAAASFQTTAQADTKYAKASDLAGVASTVSSLNTIVNKLQLANCPAGQALQKLDANGNWVCVDLPTIQGPVLATATIGGVVRQVSVNGTYCGTTAPATYNGHFSTTTGGVTIHGYAAAKLLCETAAGCGKAYAHMCTAEEITRSAQLGLFLGVTANSTFWISGGSTVTRDNVARDGNDCDGWQGTSSAKTGAVFGVGPSTPPQANVSDQGCDVAAPIGCCQ
jgi:hypothetical protein